MHVTAKDLGTGREQKITVSGGSALPRNDIDRMVREAEAHAEEDRRRKEAAEARNQGEQLVYRTEQLLADNTDKIPGDVRSETESALAELKEALKGDDDAAVRAANEKAAAAAQRIGTAIYAQAQGTSQGTPQGGTQGEGDGSAGATGTDEEVVDAEIVDDEQSGKADND